MKLHPHYPSAEEVDQWCESIYSRASKLTFTVREKIPVQYPQHLSMGQTSSRTWYVEFKSEGLPIFFGLWQGNLSGKPAPLLIHLPGYGGEISQHPELVAKGYNVLHVNPMGYFTPQGANQTLPKHREWWPVLPETIQSNGERGYADWFACVIVALRWALARPDVQPGRVGIFGLSQGGGTSLMTASILRGRGVRAIALDEPFLTHYPKVIECGMMEFYKVISTHVIDELAKGDVSREARAWKALGLVDTMSHVHRIDIPVMMTAGGKDQLCPPASIRALFDALKGTRSYTEFEHLGHEYNAEFVRMAAAWFDIHV